MIRRYVLLLLVLLLPMYIMAITDSGECGKEGSSVQYHFMESTQTLTIWGTGEMQDYDAPLSAPWNDYCDKIAIVVIKEGVTSIGNLAFDGCSNLTSVTIPESVRNIGVYVFADCPSLKEVYCYANEAPVLSPLSFSQSAVSSAILYVPLDAFDYYRSSGWNKFGFVVPFDCTVFGKCGENV